MKAETVREGDDGAMGFDKLIYVNLDPTGSAGYVATVQRLEPRTDYSLVKNRLVHHLFDYIVSGKGSVTYGGETYPVEAGDLVFMRKDCNVSYRTDPDDPYEKLWAAADGPAVTGLVAGYLGEREMVIVKNANAEPMYRLAAILTTVGHDDAKVMHCLLDLILELTDHPKPKKPGGQNRDLAEMLKSYIEHHLGERYSLDELGEYFHVSERHLIRVFGERFGVTPGAYRSERRMEAARRALIETEQPIGEIAAGLGFCDQSFFSTAFRKRYGVYPLAYRKNGKKQQN